MTSPTAIFARAITERSLSELELDLDVAATDVASAARALHSCLKASKLRPALALSALQRATACCVWDNEQIPLFFPLILALASQESTVGDAACGVLLLMAHGLGEVLHLPAAPCSPTADPTVLVLVLGFAGGSTSDLRKYTSRIYTESQPCLHVCASEVPDVYARNLEVAVASCADNALPIVVHLFSKAGFLTLARLLEALRQHGGCIEERLRAVVWDSSPGSTVDYEEFVSGTFASVELLAKKGGTSVSGNARLMQLLRSAPYAPAARDSYAPMHGLMPSFPLLNREHLFVYSRNDPVCSPADISAYAAETDAATDGRETKGADGRRATGAGAGVGVGVGVGRVTTLEINKSQHCNGLFWDTKKYVDAVQALLLRVVASVES